MVHFVDVFSAVVGVVRVEEMMLREAPFLPPGQLLTPHSPSCLTRATENSAQPCDSLKEHCSSRSHVL